MSVMRAFSVLTRFLRWESEEECTAMMSLRAFQGGFGKDNMVRFLSVVSQSGACPFRNAFECYLLTASHSPPCCLKNISQNGVNYHSPMTLGTMLVGGSGSVGGGWARGRWEGAGSVTFAVLPRFCYLRGRAFQRRKEHFCFWVFLVWSRECTFAYETCPMPAPPKKNPRASGGACRK